MTITQIIEALEAKATQDRAANKNSTTDPFTAYTDAIRLLGEMAAAEIECSLSATAAVTLDPDSLVRRPVLAGGRETEFFDTIVEGTVVVGSDTLDVRITNRGGDRFGEGLTRVGLGFDGQYFWKVADLVKVLDAAGQAPQLCQHLKLTYLGEVDQVGRKAEEELEHRFGLTSSVTFDGSTLACDKFWVMAGSGQVAGIPIDVQAVNYASWMFTHNGAVVTADLLEQLLATAAAGGDLGAAEALDQLRTTVLRRAALAYGRSIVTLEHQAHGALFNQLGLEVPVHIDADSIQVGESGEVTLTGAASLGEQTLTVHITGSTTSLSYAFALDGEAADDAASLLAKLTV